LSSTRPEDIRAFLEKKLGIVPTPPPGTMEDPPEGNRDASADGGPPAEPFVPPTVPAE
jgi:hypothetical protein